MQDIVETNNRKYTRETYRTILYLFSNLFTFKLLFSEADIYFKRCHFKTAVMTS